MATDETPKGNGGCRCGQVRFAVSGAPMFTAACHCRGCQLMSSSAYSLSTGYLAAAFEVVQGEPVIGGLHGPTRHYFCGHCMSWMFTRPEGMDHFVNVRTTLLDEPPQEVPFMETFTSEALPWANTGAKHSFESFPPMESYAPLMEEFARSQAPGGA
jgi:hypothetical protein